MDENAWSRFDDIATPDEVALARASQYTPPQEGRYEASLEEIVATETPTGLPSLNSKFRTVTNKVVYYNQILKNVSRPDLTPMNLAIAMRFISDLLGEEVEYKGAGQLAETVSMIPTGTIYNIEVYYGKTDYDKKWAKVKILGIKGNEGAMNTPTDSGEPLPF